MTKIENQCLEFIIFQNDAKNVNVIATWKWIKPQLKNAKNMNSEKLENMAKIYTLFGNKKKSNEYQLKAKKEKAKYGV